jgi:hypothetical protein
VQQHIVVPEGNKAFPVVIDTKALAPPSPAPPAPPALTAPTAPPALTALTAPTAPPVIPATAGNEAPKSSGLRAPTYVLGGVALVGLASFVGFALAGESAQSCAPSCSRSQISTVRRDYAVADVSLLAALAAGGGALYFALTSKPEASGATSAARRTTAWWLGVRVEGGGPWLGGGTTF